MTKRRIVLAGLVVLAAIAILAIVAGAAFGIAWALIVLAAGLAGVAAFDIWHLERLVRWADAPLDTEAPEGMGIWRDAFAALHRRARVRRRDRADLSATIDRFRSAAEALPDGMVIMDAANRVQWANARAQAHLGVDRERDVGAPLGNLARHPELVRYLETSDFSEAAMFESQREPGTMLSVQVVPFGVEQKLLISRDVSELEAVARMRRDFIANVSHELKTPLTVVAGFIETLQDVELDAGRRTRYLALMAEQARSMQRLVDDLLTLSALESEHNPLAESAFPVAPLLVELEAAAKALSAGQHKLSVDIVADAMLRGNRDELASAFGNLVSNAVRYTPEGGTITLAWQIADDGRGAFSVSDTGIGIAAEHIPRLTERFYRVDRSRSRATGGTGLGLAIVKHVLLRHQAELHVTSELGMGSTFTVLLPAHRVRPRGRAAEEGAGVETAPAAIAPSPDATSTAMPR